MDIYIEYVLLDNLLIDWLILFLTSSLLKIKFKKLNMLLSIVIGTAFAVAMPLINLNSYLLFFLKLLVGIAMVLVLKKFTFKKFIITFITFISITFMMGGMCFGIMYLLNLDFTINGILIYGFEVPMSLFLICVFGYLYLTVKIISVVRHERQLGKYTYNITLTCNDKEYSLVGFLDTGNMVYDNGKPVIILSYKSFKKIFKNITFDRLLTRKVVSELDHAHYIDLSSANSSNKMLVFNAQKLEISEDKKSSIYENIEVGLSYKKFNNFDCILHPDFF